MVTAGSGAVALAAPHDPRKLEKAYNPDQPRDWHGRFGEGEGSPKQKERRGAQVAQAQLAPTIAREIANDAPKVWPYIASGVTAAGEAVREWWNTSHSSKHADTPTPVSPATSDEPEQDKPNRQPRFRGDNFGPELDKPAVPPPNDHPSPWPRRSLQQGAIPARHLPGKEKSPLLRRAMPRFQNPWKARYQTPKTPLSTRAKYMTTF